uniref:USP domain-containing protein n=1 Tax=Oryza meridionalis TaxID=40149 RepID=A0A0E0CE76_9ORYZ
MAKNPVQIYVMDDEKRPRVGDTAESPRKSPRLVHRIPTTTDQAESGVGLKSLLGLIKNNPSKELDDPNAASLGVIDVEKKAARPGDTAATALDVNDWWEKVVELQWMASVGGDCRARRCRHVLYGEDDINLAIALIKTCDDTPMCNADNCGNTEGREISACLDCESRFCTTHGKWHASVNKHWVALVYKKPHVAYCFACEECYFIRTEHFGVVMDNEDDYFISLREEDEKGMRVDNVAGDHASGSVIGHACPIKGIPNLGNTCYLNSLLQCLLVLGRLRAGILGLDAPLGLLGSSLRSLFDDADSVNNAGGLLDPEKLLACVRMLNPEFKGNGMHDSQEALCILRTGLDKEERAMKLSNMQAGAPSAVAPTVIDSIFGGQLSVTSSCKHCSVRSLSHDVFHDLSVPLPQESPAKSDELSPWTKGRRSPRKIRINLLSAIDKHKSDNEKTQSPASELEDVFLVKRSKPLKVDSTKVEQISHSMDAGGPLQTRKDKVQGKVVDVLPRIPEDPASPSFVSPLSEEKNDSAVQPEVSTEAKMTASSAKVTTKDKGKTQISDVVYDKAHDINSLASIEKCLELYLETEIEWTCENCSKVLKKPGIMSSTKEDTTAGDQSEQLEKSAHQVEENQNEQKDKNECPIQTRLIRKLPPVLTIHLMRYLEDLTKVIGHVSFKEILDVGQFMDPSSEDRDNSRYRLVGFVEHLGPSMYAGHYVAYVRPSRPQQTNGSSSWGTNPPNMQDGAVTPTVIDSIFGGQLSSHISFSHVAFHDLSVPLPPTQSKSIASPPRTKGYKSQQKIHAELFPVDKSNPEKIHTIAEDSDSQSPSELEDVVLVKTSEPLKVDSTKVEQIFHNKDAVCRPLQTQKDKFQGETVDFLPQNMLPDVKVEEMDLTKTDAHVPKDIGPPLRKENAWIESGSDVGKNVSAVLDDVFSEPEVSSEAKTDTFSVEVRKSRSSDISCDKAQGINSLASIDKYLELHFEAEMVEWTCESCSKVAEKPGINLGKYSNPMMSSTNEDITVYGDRSELSEKITCRSEQSNGRPECHEGVQEAVPSCIPAEKQANLLSGQDQNASILSEEREQVKLHHGAHQVEENQNEQKDWNKGGIKKHFISKLPPVLVIHLMRSLLGPHKVIGHVRFKEILDMGLFMDPSSEDKDNLSYRLVGVVEHRGLGNDAGHFLAYVRASPRQQTSGSSSWFRASDDSIREVSLEEVLKCEAYLLFYERMES